MKKLLVIGLLAAFCATPAFAALKVGDTAPDFTAAGSLGGKDFTFNLKDALKKGPVVVYFYPSRLYRRLRPGSPYLRRTGRQVRRRRRHHHRRVGRRSGPAESVLRRSRNSAPANSPSPRTPTPRSPSPTT